MFKYMFKTIFPLSLIISISLTLCIQLAVATKKPSVPDLVKISDIILIGTVIEASKTTTPNGFTVKIQSSQILKGSKELPKLFEIEYKRIGKRNINFQELSKNNETLVFFLKEKASNKTNYLKLADEWFSVKKATKSLISEIHSIQSGILLSIEESGGCHRLSTCGIYILYNSGYFTLSRNSGKLPSTYNEMVQNTVVRKTSTLKTDATKKLKILIQKQDFNKLKSNLDKGSCAGCVDGVDHRIFILQKKRPIELTSSEYKLNGTNQPILIEIFYLYKLMSEKLKLKRIT